MAENNKIKLQFTYADETTSTVELNGFASDSATLNPTTLRARVNAFDPTTVKNILVSDGGSSCTEISAATISKVKETEIYRNQNG